MVSNEDISFSVFQKKERKTDRQIDRQKEKKENELSEISADTFLVHLDSFYCFTFSLRCPATPPSNAARPSYANRVSDFSMCKVSEYMFGEDGKYK
jgi:hypothetical protein